MDDIFKEVKARVNIEDVVSYYAHVQFKNHKCHCQFPDHQDVKSPSFSVKDNCFNCFGCGRKGDVISFVKMFNMVSELDAVKMINNDFHLGIQTDNKPTKFNIKSYLLKCEKDISLTDYFQKRGLSPTTIKRFRLGFDKTKNMVTIPYSGDMSYGIARATKEKFFWKPKAEDVGPEPLYNAIALKRQTEEPVFIVESQICAMSIEQYGGKAVAVCGGGAVSKLDKALKGLKTGNLGFIIALDNDDAGQKYASELGAFLKGKNIKYITYNVSGTEKDPNDLLQKSPELLVKHIIKAKEEFYKSCTNYGDLKSAKEITTMDIAPTNWLVEDLFTTGLSIICGASKIGKSWFVQNMCLAVSTGTRFLDKPTHKCTCWYMALEDDDALTKMRLNKMLKGGEAPNNFLISHEIYPMDRVDKNRPTLIEYIKQNVQRNKEIKLVIIDTFQKVRSASLPGESMYAHDYRDISTLKQLADELRLAIVVIHHTNKMKDRDTDGDPFAKVSGTNGLMASADCIFLLDKKRDEQKVNFAFTGRKIRCDTYVLTQNEDMTWNKIGTAEEEAYKTRVKEHASSPYVITIKHLLATNNGDWEGSATAFIEQIGKLYKDGFPIKSNPTTVGKDLNELTNDLKVFDGIIHLNINPSGGVNGRMHRFYYVRK